MSRTQRADPLHETLLFITDRRGLVMRMRRLRCRTIWSLRSQFREQNADISPYLTLGHPVQSSCRPNRFSLSSALSPSVFTNPHPLCTLLYTYSWAIQQSLCLPNRFRLVQQFEPFSVHGISSNALYCTSQLGHPAEFMSTQSIPQFATEPFSMNSSQCTLYCTPTVGPSSAEFMSTQSILPQFSTEPFHRQLLSVHESSSPMHSLLYTYSWAIQCRVHVYPIDSPSVQH
ncbi:hypothetical protein J6590_102919 [Homalodisca vitripennis]|nr:hypothetical protein J6590_102919 [Homalodisca vitripennis]